MGLDFVERFFKLTLDNVYRFACSFLFVVALVSWGRTRSSTPIEYLWQNQSWFPGVLTPTEQLAEVLNWLAIPSAWLTPVGNWLTDRDAVVGAIATMTLMVAVAFASANDWRSRSGSIALLSVVVLIQVGRFTQVAMIVSIALFGLALFTGLAAQTAYRRGQREPRWTKTAWEKIGNVAMTVGLAAAYLLSPLGWLVSQESQSHNVRGTLWNPLYVEQVERRRPTGAISK